MKSLKWGIIGTGNIAGVFADALSQTQRGQCQAVAGRDAAKAKAFAKQRNIPQSYGSYASLLLDQDIDAVYVATPHPMHAEWVIKAAEAGKHILCEKPMTMSWADTMTVIDAARRHDVFLMEAFMYRCAPQTEKLVALIRDKAIGDIRMIDATFGFNAAFNRKSRLFDAKLGGGGILDVGGYPMSMARLIAGTALGVDVAEPMEVKASAHIGPSGVDEWTAATAAFEGGIVARLATGVRCAMENKVVIYGDKGKIEVPAPWFCQGREAGSTTILVNDQRVRIQAKRGVYAMEAETVAASIERRQASAPAMSWNDSLGQAKALDLWKQAIGLEYPAEMAKAYRTTLSHRPLKVRQPVLMPYGTIPDVEKPISKLAMGTMAASSIGHATALYDEFFARGGNIWDTAYIYKGGTSETLLGQWIQNRRCREKVVIMAKGAHTPYCDPANLVSQLNESLERLQTDYADLYFMHRDNEDIPVEEFVDVLNQLRDEGRIHAFGVSNWTLKRVKEANRYALKRGVKGMVAVSNNFSLAQLVNPLWGVSLTSSQPEFRAWHEKTGTPCFGWSSQAQGFFDPSQAAPRKRNPALEPYWYSSDNFERQKRALQLARQKDCHPMAIATAYCLAQSFPLYVLVGPATLMELNSTFDALKVTLSQDEVEWLETGKKS